MLMLYHPQSDHARAVEEFARDFKVLKTKNLDLFSLETKEGSALAKLYDIVQYPAILVVQESDELVKDWQGMPLPLMDEVIGYSG